MVFLDFEFVLEAFGKAQQDFTDVAHLYTKAICGEPFTVQEVVRLERLLCQKSNKLSIATTS